MGSSVNNSAFTHFASVLPNYTHMESNSLPSFLEPIIDEQMPIEKGYRVITDRPGIGIEINEDALSRFPQKKIEIDGCFHADGSVAH